MKFKSLSVLIVFLLLIYFIPFTLGVAETANSSLLVTSQQQSNNTFYGSVNQPTSQISFESQPAKVVEPNWVGFGEGYTDQYSYTRLDNWSLVLPDWNNEIDNLTSSSTNFVKAFGINAFRLSFRFPNMNSTEGGALTGVLNYSVMDSVISFLSSKGFKVILDDHTGEGFGSFTWVNDWRQMTIHYVGNPNVLAFELYNEPTSATWSANVTTNSYDSMGSVASAYYNATLAVRQIDPQRTVIWRNVDIYNVTCSNNAGGFGCMTLDRQFMLPNVLYDFHLYNGGTTQQWSYDLINAELRISRTFDVPIICMELDSAGGNMSLENSTLTVWDTNQLVQKHIPWFGWSYVLQSSRWVPLLAHITPFQSIRTSFVPNGQTWSTNLLYIPIVLSILPFIGIGAAMSGIDVFRVIVWRIGRSYRLFEELKDNGKSYIVNDFREEDDDLDHYIPF